MIILIWLISLWAALSFIIAAFFFFGNDDPKIGRYNWKFALNMGVLAFTSPIWIIEAKLSSLKDKRNLLKKKV